ncbi:hypothetical protein H2203_003563 [Taxawa tesnikishii (nom. ined.)]|nr:hypothetical protein H2203_003563 [Dothideales sp. JES 119]
MPVWGIFLAFGMAAFYLIPVGTVFAVASSNSNVLTVPSEVISGFAPLGKPIILLISKFCTYTIGKFYSGLLHLLWLGQLLPIVVFLLKKRFPNNKVLNADNIADVNKTSPETNTLR